MSGPAGSPTDKLRKDSALTPVTSEKSILFYRLIKIVTLCKGLIVWEIGKFVKGITWKRRGHYNPHCMLPDGTIDEKVHNSYNKMMG